MSEPDVASIVESLQKESGLGGELVHSLYLLPEPARFGEPEPPLPESIGTALTRRGLDRLWSHQAEGLGAVRRGENVLITTPTASGKSLVFQLPVLEEAARGGPGRALFLFPLKALGQDQKGKFDALAAEAGLSDVADCEIYDGDTSQYRRRKIKENPPRVLVTNPDMLHRGLLSYWPQWTTLLGDLRWIVLDELHTYRGIFGSHFHHVLHRLLRLCREQGSDPMIIASSATAMNAGEFAQTLCGREFNWISESGAPREGRHVLLFQPTASPYTMALHLLVTLLRSGMKTIVFTKARRITELLYSWLVRQSPELANRVASYRSGFLPEERRRIEADLFSGRLDGVISTSALEMGIDVGGLDACILVGYPGSVMATWQRSGRVGRSDRESITGLIALPDALDQYLLEHPGEFMERPCERLIVDPENEIVTRTHLVCAASELPLRREQDRAYLERNAAIVGDLLQARDLTESADGRELYTAQKRPQRHVDLRGSGHTYAILDAGSGELIGTVDGVRVMHECHPGAVYLHAGRQYLVRDLDLDAGKAHAEAVSVDYYTTPLTEKETDILEVLDRRTEGPLVSFFGRLRVTERVTGFERRRIRGRDVIDQGKLDLPPVQFETVGFWWLAPSSIRETLTLDGQHFLGSLHASEHAAISLLPSIAICDRGDIGGISIPLHPQVGAGSVFVYDGHPGGIGIAAKGFQNLSELLQRVLDLLDRCVCDVGCPSCIHSPKCGNGNRPLDKEGAARILRILLGHEEVDARVSEAGASEIVADIVPLEEMEQGKAARPEPERPVLESGSVEKARPVRERKSRRSGRSGRTVLFDLETQKSAKEVGGWDKAHRMLVAIGVTCDLETGRFTTYREEGVPDLLQQLEAADLVVGFNIRRFDYSVLSGYTGLDYARRLPTLDLLDDIYAALGFRLSLNHLAQETLGIEKSADGLQSLEWFREGRLDLIEEYCRKDVEILRDLYLYGRREGYLTYRDRQKRAVRVSVAW